MTMQTLGSLLNIGKGEHGKGFEQFA